MSMSNSDRTEHGKNAQDGLEAVMQHCLELGYIKSIVTNYRVGLNGYPDDQQFYAPFLIELPDGKKWAIYSTTSMRDRFKGQLWDAYFLKKIDSSIIMAYLVYPDGLDSKTEKPFLTKKFAINSKSGYYSIDDILSQDEFNNIIETYVLGTTINGSNAGKLGNKFEDRVAHLLSYSANLQKWKTGAATLEGLHYNIFSSIVECFELPKDKTLSITATSNKKAIGHLPSGGNPKTDVLVDVQFLDGTSSSYTISCKRSSAKEVSIHDYTADQFAEILDENNEELRLLLEGFQAAGSLSAFGETNCDRLSKVIAPYVKKLSLWTLGGEYGYGNKDTQWAEYILTYDTTDNTTSIHRLLDYYDALISEKHSRNFGTPFSWTYPSKQRGKRIQLKSKIIK